MKTWVKLKLQYYEVQMSSQTYFSATGRLLVVQMIFWKKKSESTLDAIFLGHQINSNEIHLKKTVSYFSDYFC